MHRHYAHPYRSAPLSTHHHTCTRVVWRSASACKSHPSIMSSTWVTLATLSSTCGSLVCCSTRAIAIRTDGRVSPSIKPTNVPGVVKNGVSVRAVRGGCHTISTYQHPVQSVCHRSSQAAAACAACAVAMPPSAVPHARCGSRQNVHGGQARGATAAHLPSDEEGTGVHTLRKLHLQHTHTRFCRRCTQLRTLVLSLVNTARTSWGLHCACVVSAAAMMSTLLHTQPPPNWGHAHLGGEEFAQRWCEFILHHKTRDEKALTFGCECSLLLLFIGHWCSSIW